VHGVGTVGFTVSAQFGVPVIVIWALTRGITSYASEIVASPAAVEYATRRLSLRSPRQWPVAAVESKGAKGPLMGHTPPSPRPSGGTLGLATQHVFPLPILVLAGESTSLSQFARIESRYTYFFPRFPVRTPPCPTNLAYLKTVLINSSSG
jgi:hypothetical protein